jgi:hypothetical protein
MTAREQMENSPDEDPRCRELRDLKKWFLSIQSEVEKGSTVNPEVVQKIKDGIAKLEKQLGDGGG